MERTGSRARNWAFVLFLSSMVPAPGTALGQEVIELPGEDAPLRVELGDLYSVGALDGEEWETFSTVASVAFDARGNLLILDRGNCRVVKVGPDGQLVTEMGGEGGGPGEFGHPGAMAVTSDGAIAVFDMGQRGFTLFNPDGSFRTTVPLADGFDAIPGSELFPLPEGGVAARGTTVVRASSSGVSTSGESAGRPIFGYSLEDGSSETLFQAWKPQAPSPDQTRVGGSGGRMVVYGGSMSRAFDPELHLGILADGSMAVVDSSAYRVKLVGEGGEITKVLSRPIPPQPVTRRIREQEKARRLAEVEAGEGGGVAVIDGGQVTVMRHSGTDLLKQQMEKMEFAEEIPVVSGLATDREDRLWVQRVGSGLGERGPIDILGGDGSYLGSLDPEAIRIPDAFGPGGLVAFIEKDELDVPRVEVKRMQLIFP